MSHLCHAHDCTREIPPHLFMCGAHWYGLRKPVRDAIYREYRPGQEDDKRPSWRYLAVQRFAVGELAFRPHDEEAATITMSYMVEAYGYRQRAIDLGQGDPLKGLTDHLPDEELGRMMEELLRKSEEKKLDKARKAAGGP